MDTVAATAAAIVDAMETMRQLVAPRNTLAMRLFRKEVADSDGGGYLHDDDDGDDDDAWWMIDD